jgi:hypothetical protein
MTLWVTNDTEKEAHGRLAPICGEDGYEDIK